MKLNYCRHIRTKQTMTFTGTPKLPGHVSQYAFYAIPKGCQPDKFLGSLIWEDNEVYGKRVEAEAVRIVGRDVHPNLLRQAIRNKFANFH